MVQTISFYNNVIVHYSVGRKKKREPSYRRMATVVEIPIYGLHDNNHSSLCISFLYVLFSFSYRIYRRWQQQILQEFHCHLLAWQNSDRRPNKMLFHFTAFIFGVLLFFPTEIWSVEQTAAKFWRCLCWVLIMNPPYNPLLNLLCILNIHMYCECTPDQTNKLR